MTTNYEALEKATQAERNKFMSLPIISNLINSNDSSDYLYENSELLRIYENFLIQSYYHVQVAPLVYALAGSRVSDNNELIRDWLFRHSVEEHGHHHWILSDLQALNKSTDQIKLGTPNSSSSALVGYMYFVAGVDNPVGILGDSFVIEGLSQLFATQLALAFQSKLGIPDSAVTYLAKHGVADQGHMEDLRNLIDNNVHNKRDLDSIIHTAKVEFDLYKSIVESL